MKPLKHKKYRVKGNKNRRQKTYSVQRTSSSSSSAKTMSTPQQPKVQAIPQVQQQTQIKNEPTIINDTTNITLEAAPVQQQGNAPVKNVSDIPNDIKTDDTNIVDNIPQPSSDNKSFTIADTKIGIPPSEENLEEAISNLNTGNTYSFEKDIVFIDKTDLFQNGSDATAKINELVQVLKNNSDIAVTIIGNTATTEPNGTIIYGSSLVVYSQDGVLNGQSVTVYDVMMARANQVKKLLIENGISENKMKTKAGSHRKYANERVVTFILEKQ